MISLFVDNRGNDFNPKTKQKSKNKFEAKDERIVRD